MLWLAVGTGVLAVAMAVLLGLQITQKRAIERANDLRADSVTALVFQFEREFLRFRQTLEASVIRPGAPDADNLTLRYDLFLSRLSLLRGKPDDRADHPPGRIPGRHAPLGRPDC